MLKGERAQLCGSKLECTPIADENLWMREAVRQS